MLNKYLTTICFAICLLITANATPPKLQTGNLPILGSCTTPSEQALRCLGQWACQHAIRLDLRCLLNLNGTPLLGGLLGGTGGLLGGAGGLLGGGGGGLVPGAATGAASGAANGLLGGLLGR